VAALFVVDFAGHPARAGHLGAPAMPVLSLIAALFR